MGRPQASVIIRVKDEASAIAATLDGVFAQRDVDEFEVVVVDSGSTDGTTDVVRKFPVTLVEIAPHTFTYGRALNIGVRAARSERVVSLSAHSFPAHEHWLASLIGPLGEHGVAGVYGQHRLTRRASMADRIAVGVSGVAGTRPRIQVRRVMFSNANSAFRRDLAVAYPFDEALGGGEDAAWAFKVQRAGWAIRYEPDAAVFHEHNESFPRLARRVANDLPTIARLQLRSLMGRVTSP
jgi:rhamnosyltransferase